MASQLVVTRSVEMVFHFVLPQLSNLALLVLFYVSAENPWVEANIVLKEQFFSISTPIDVGLFKCFSEICEEYYIEKQREKEKKNGQISETSQQLPIPIPPGLNPTGGGNGGGDGISKFPDSIVHEIEKTFKRASLATIPFISLAIMCAILSSFTSVHVWLSKKEFKYKGQMNLLLLVPFLSGMACVTYVAYTVNSLDGGSYKEGMHLAIAATIISCGVAALSATVRFFAKISSQPVYERLDDDRIQIKLGSK